VKGSGANRALGRTLRELRRERGHSQKVVAARCGVSRSYFGAIERGEVDVPLDVIFKLADGLGVSVSELVATVRF
jgi:transcriptional regulator with XRE-family HTH domain